MAAFDMATPFDAFLQTQGRMQSNDAQAIANQVGLAKLNQLQRDQALESNSRQLGMQIAQENLKKQSQPPAVTLANLSEMPDANAESQGLRSYGAPKEVASPAQTTPPKQSEVLSQQADDLRKQARQFGAIGNLAQQKVLMEESDKVREKLYLTQAEERKQQVADLERAGGAIKAINSQDALTNFWDSSDGQHRQAIAGMFNLGLDGKPIYDDKGIKAVDYLGNKVMSAKDQSTLALKAVDEQLKAQRAETDRLRQVAQEAYQKSEAARKREQGDTANTIKAGNLALGRLKTDPFGILTSQPDVTISTDGSRAPNGVTFDQKSGRMYKDGIDVTEQLKNGTVSTADPAALKAALGSDTHGEAFLKLVPPAVQGRVLAIAEGRQAMPPQGRTNPENSQLRTLVTQYDPNYREGDYASGAAAEKAFTSGRLGSSVRSFNVATQHLDTLQKAADALDNGNIPAFNAIGNYIAQQTGQPAPTEFNAVKRIVADEIVKAIVGGQNAVSDRKDAADSVNAANSPAQLSGVIKEYKTLMAGQLEGLEKQYEASTKKKDFRTRFLTPAAQTEVVGQAGGAHPSDIQSLLKKYGR